LVNGINYGCQHEGYYDHPIVFFQNISQQFFMDQRMNKERFVAANGIALITHAVTQPMDLVKTRI
jgi:hypothetical protein